MADNKDIKRKINLKQPLNTGNIGISSDKNETIEEKLERNRILNPKIPTGPQAPGDLLANNTTIVSDEDAKKELSAQEKSIEEMLKYLMDTFLGKILYDQDEKGKYIPGYYKINEETLDRTFVPDSKVTTYKENETITDVSFDGYNVYIQDNEVGRFRLNDPEKDIRIRMGLPPLKVTPKDVEVLGKGIAMRMGRAWNPSAPIMDVELGHLRTNFMEGTVAPYGVTMAVRVSRATLALRDIRTAANQELADLLAVFMRCGVNLLISGPTGTGKTEMQKNLIQFIPDDQKISLMEDTLDSHIKLIYKNKDINSWATVKRGSGSVLPEIGFQDLIRSGLRNNPDWLMVSEVRGAEAEALLSAALTSHSIMTTLHASGAANIPARVTDMVAQAKAMDYGALQRNIVSVLNIGIQLERLVKDGKTVRRIKEMYEYVNYEPDLGIIGYPVYEVNEILDADTGEYRTVTTMNRLSDNMLKRLQDAREIQNVPDVFKTGTYIGKTVDDKRRALDNQLE